MNAAGIIVTCITGIVGCAVLTAIVATARFRRATRAMAEDFWLAATRPAGDAITLDDIRELPAPVRTWLVRAGVIGAPAIERIRLKQMGRIRQDANANWMAFEAEQYFTTASPQFAWIATVPMLGVPTVVVRDALIDSHGSMRITAAGLITIDDKAGPELDQGALLRYLGEVAWFPSAALAPYISWRAFDERSAEATITAGETKASAIVVFDDAGDIVRLTGRRFMTVDDGYSLENQSFYMSGHVFANGVRTPRDVRGVWHLSSGDLESINLHVDTIEYDTDDTY